MKRLIIIALLTASFTASVFAKQVPIPYPSDGRIKMVAYQENNVIPIYGKTFTSTQIIFGPGESILDVEGGDTSGWMVTHHKNLPNMVFLKPTMLGSDTNMTIVTNKHNYYFHLMSNTSLDKRSIQQTYAIKFKYPIEARRRLNAKLKLAQQRKHAIINSKKNPKAYNWHYRFSGNHQIMPLHVFDDGTFTFFELRKNQPVPAIFAVEDRSGKESVVNTRIQGNYIVVQRLAPQFTLRNGLNMVASVFNSNEIMRIKHGRG